MNLLKKKIIKNALILVAIFELISLLSFFVWEANLIGFGLLCLIFFIIAWKNIAYGLGVVLIELLIGSHGHLFSVPIFGFSLSIRMAFFLILLLIFCLHILAQCKGWNYWLSEKQIQKLHAFMGIKQRDPCVLCQHADKKYVILFFCIIAFGVISGLWQNNNMMMLFDDANSYAFLLLAFIFYQVVFKKEHLSILYSMMLAGLIASLIKIYVLMYLFSHQFLVIMPQIYRWVRVTGVGEITRFEEGFYRIFFQSQIFHLIAIFIISLLLYQMLKAHEMKTKRFFWTFVLFCALQSSLMISFSRSFWVAALFTFLLYMLWLGVKERPTVSLWLSFISVHLMGSVVGFVFIASILYFPIPPSSVQVDTLRMLEERAKRLEGEAAIVSRWNLLPILWADIQENYLFGKGFGRALTYQSEDPRIIELFPEGKYTTHVFEWGYLDTWLKMGLAGLFMYALILYVISKRFLKGVKETIWHMGWYFGLVALYITSFFSPYLNHPLGLAYILFLFAFSARYIHMKKFNS